MTIDVILTYYQNIDRTWDVLHGRRLIVKDAPTLSHAQIFSDVLLTEELGKVFVAQETINYVERV